MCGHISSRLRLKSGEVITAYEAIKRGMPQGVLICSECGEELKPHYHIFVCEKCDKTTVGYQHF